MIKTSERKKLSAKELEIAELAGEQFERNGKVDIKCPRCNSELKVQITTSSESVKCVTDDFSYTLRGI